MTFMEAFLSYRSVYSCLYTSNKSWFSPLYLFILPIFTSAQARCIKIARLMVMISCKCVYSIYLNQPERRFFHTHKSSPITNSTTIANPAAAIGTMIMMKRSLLPLSAIAHIYIQNHSFMQATLRSSRQ